MTDGLDQAMVQVAFDLLAADPITPPLNVIPGPVPNPTPPLPYIVIWALVDWPDDPQRKSLDGLVTSGSVRWIIHIQAETEKSWWAIAQRVRTQLLNVRPTIAGMNPDLIRMASGSEPPTPNEVLGVPVISGMREFTLTCDT